MVGGTILIFVKAPAAGEVKTRLIPALGALEAATLYRAMAMDTLSVARQLPDTSITIAYQAHPDFPDPSWLAEDVPWFTQEGSDLGQRLVHATRRVLEQRRAPVLVIGSDLPVLTPTLLEAGFDALRRAPAVIGPAYDGGYYLVGLTGPAPFLFEGIRWSSPQVLEQTQRIMARKHLAVEYLPLRRDLDTLEDLRIFEAAAGSLGHFPQTQAFLLRRRQEVPLQPS